MRALYLSWEIDLPAYNEDDSWTLPMPARYLIDQDRVVRWAHADPDYTVRPEPEETIEALKRL